MSNKSSLLKSTLLVDSAFSLIAGVVLLLFSQGIAAFLGLSAAWSMLLVGGIALVYGIVIFLAARAERVNLGIARFAAYGNLLWALVAAVLVLADLVPFSTAGKWTVAVIADAGLLLAIFQFLGLRRTAR